MLQILILVDEVYFHMLGTNYLLLVRLVQYSNHFAPFEYFSFVNMRKLEDISHIILGASQVLNRTHSVI